MNSTVTSGGNELFIAYWDESVFDSGETSGNTPDIAYAAGTGAGYEAGDAFTWGDGISDTSLETARITLGGELVYRFDSVSPLFAYTLDLAFYRPDGLPIQYQVFADDRLLKLFVADTHGAATEESFSIDLNQGAFDNTSYASGYLPAAVLADESVRIRIVAVGDFPVALSHIQLKRGSRIFIDCGGSGTLATGEPADPSYASNYIHPGTSVRYGYFTTAPASASFPFGSGSSSTDTMRYGPAGRIGYRFSNLDPSQNYVVRPTLKGSFGGYHQFEINGVPVGVPIQLPEVPTTFNVLIGGGQIQAPDDRVELTVSKTDAVGNPVAGTTTLVDLELNEFTAADAMAADFDLDGIPDRIELAYAAPGGMNPSFADSMIDLDGDGMTNGEEVSAGTDPTDRASVFEVNEVEFNETSEGLVVAWACETGQLYTVQVSGDLNNWSTVAENLPGEADGSMQRTINVSDLERAFVRVVTRSWLGF